MKLMSCHNNNIKILDRLPPNLDTLQCQHNNIKILRDVPQYIQSLFIYDNFFMCYVDTGVYLPRWDAYHKQIGVLIAVDRMMRTEEIVECI